MSYRSFITSAQSFFAELAENNNREWFLARKERYDEEISAPSKAFAGEIAEVLSNIMGRPYRAKLFRVHRDVRFSKDKSPYKTHLHMSFADGQEAQKQNKFDMQNDYPSFFCGIDPGGMHVDEALEGEGFSIKAPEFWFMIGYLGFGKERLLIYRRFIDVYGDEVARLMEKGDCVVSRFGADSYKRVPKHYAVDHPHEALLRRKSLVLGREMQTAFDKGKEPMALIQETLQILKPLIDLIDLRLIKHIA